MDLSTTFASIRKQVAGLSLVALVAGLFATGVATAQTTGNIYSDVPADAWFAPYVNGLSAAGVIDSTNDMYRPGDLVNRAEMAKFAFMVSGLPLEAAAEAPYKDVAMGQWYTNYVYTLTKNGIVSGDKLNGVPTGFFRPSDNLNRAEASKMLVNSAQMAEDLSGAPHFPDVSSSEWYYNYVETLFNNGVIAGYPDGYFRPANFINRAEVAKMVYLSMSPAVVGFSLESAAAASATKVELIFSMNVDEALAEVAANYMIEDTTGTKLTVSAAEVVAGDTVHLTTSAQTEGKIYEVTVKNLTSDAGDVLSNLDPVSFLGYGSDVSGGALQVSLSTQTPVAGSVPNGATGVVFTCWDFKAGSSAVMIKSLRVHRVGPGSEAAFLNTYLYRGDTRLTTGRSINNETQMVEFNNINQTISANENAKICLVGDLDILALTGGVHAFELLAATDVLTNSSSMTGSFPLRGADQLITSAEVGEVEVLKNGSLDEATIGQVGARIAQFELQASSEESVKLSRLALYIRGTVGRGDLANFKLYSLVGDKLAEVAGVNDNDLAVFTLASGYTLEKGESRIFYVTADIVGARNGDTVKSYIDETTDVYAVGGTYGYGVRVVIDGAGGYDGSIGKFSEVTIKGADFTIISNPLTATEVALNQNDAKCLDLSLINASGSDLTIQKWQFNIEDTTATGDIDKANYTQFKLVKLNEDGTAGNTMLGSNELAAGANNSQLLTLSGDYIIPADTTVRAGLVFDVENVALLAGSGIRCSLNPVTTGERVLDINNDELGESSITPNSAITGNTLDVVASQLTVTRSTAVQSTSYTKGTTNANLLALQFQAGSAQDQVIKEVQLNVKTVIDDDDIPGNDDGDPNDLNGVIDSCTNPASQLNDTCTKPSDSVLSVQLLDGANVLATTNIVNASATTGLGEVTFRNLSVPVTKSTSKVLTVRAFINNTADAELIGVWVGGIVAVDGEGRNTTGIVFTAIDTVAEAPVMTIATPVVTGADSSLDTVKQVVAAEETFQTLRFKLRSANGNTTLQDLEFAVIGNVYAIKDASISKLEAGVCGAALKTGTVDTANAMLVFDNVGVTLENNKDTTLCVNITNNTIAGSSDLNSGDVIGLSLSQDNAGVGGAADGYNGEITDLRDSTNTNIASTLAGFGTLSPVLTTVYRSIPVVSKNTISPTLSSGIIEVANFTLAKSGENFELDQLMFDFSSTGLTSINSCSLYNGMTLVANADVVTLLVAEFTNGVMTPYSVDSTKTLSLKCDVVVNGAATLKSLGVALQSVADVIEWDDGDLAVAGMGNTIIEAPISWSLN